MKNSAVSIVVKGLVQGVGFRYFCSRQAHRFRLTGWVKNLPDGSVSIEVEGDQAEIESFLGRVKDGPTHSDVRDLSVTWTEYSGRYTEFEITG